MIEWLRRPVGADPTVRIGDRALPVVIRRNGRAKRMILRLGPAGREVCVTLPPWGRTAEALAFARSRAGWLEAQLAGLPAPGDPAAEGRIAYRGADLPIAWDRRHPRQPRLDHGVLALGGPADTVARRLQRWLEAEAERLMATDLVEYCARAGLDAPPLRLSRARRRWGSCSASGTVRVNWRLVQAPDPVRRSVVAHEVAHLVHFDHSPAFHACLAGLFEGDLAQADGWLKREGRTLYRQFG